MKIINLQIEIFLLVLVGYILSKVNILTKETRTHLTDMILDFILPVATIKSFMIQMTPRIIRMTIVVFLISVGIQCLYFILNRFCYNRFSLDESINMKYGTMVSSAGFMGMPVAEQLFGHLGLLYACIYLIPQRIFMWSYGLSMYTTSDLKTMIKKVLSHPCVIAIYIGVLLMLLRMKGYVLPEGVTLTIQSVAGCNTALSMIVVGAILSDVEPHEMLDGKAAYFSLIRLIIIPVLVYFILSWTNLDKVAIGTCVLLAAMPAASTTVMLANKYNRNPQFASKLMFLSTILSLFTLPMISIMIH